jgi:RNA polymerase sigma-70 factor (ECF subfamily)
MVLKVNEQDRQILFSDLINHHQSEIYAYIFAIVRNWEDADDLFQSVCCVLWSKFDTFRIGSSFLAWARQTAKLTVRKFLRQKQLRKYVSEPLLDALTDTTAGTKTQGTEQYLAALEQCREKLDTADIELLELRYVNNLRSREIADRLSRPHQGVCNSLTRIQRWLFECIQMELARQEHGWKGRT